MTGAGVSVASIAGPTSLTVHLYQGISILLTCGGSLVVFCCPSRTRKRSGGCRGGLVARLTGSCDLKRLTWLQLSEGHRYRTKSFRDYSGKWHTKPTEAVSGP